MWVLKQFKADSEAGFVDVALIESTCGCGIRCLVGDDDENANNCAHLKREAVVLGAIVAPFGSPSRPPLTD